MASLFKIFHIYYTTNLLKILLFQTKKPFGKIVKGLEIVKLPLLERFRTFCWGEIIEELQNIYKLKELIGLPVSAINNV